MPATIRLSDHVADVIRVGADCYEFLGYVQGNADVSAADGSFSTCADCASSAAPSSTTQSSAGQSSADQSSADQSSADQSSTASSAGSSAPLEITLARAASTTSKYFSHADDADWDFGTGDFTINVWTKHTSGDWAVTHGGDLFGGGSTDGWMFAAADTAMLFRNWGTGGMLYDRFGFTDTGILDGNWHMMTMRRIGTTFQYFADGVKPTTSFTSSVALDDGAGEELRILRQADGGNWRGNVGATTIWTRGLSDAEITALYNGGCGMDPRGYGGAYLTSLQNAWPMDESTGSDDAEDVSGTKDLTPNGAGLATATGPCP